MTPNPPIPHSAAAERNSEPILQVLRQLLGDSGNALEIASGTGQHAAHFAKALPGWRWQPTDRQPDAFDAIEAWAALKGASNVLAPLELDVLQDQWPSTGAPFGEKFDLIYCANMLHISPWATCAGLMQGAARHLAPNGMLITYGPYLEKEIDTSPGNLAFDADLRARNSAWGIRHRTDVESEAQRSGLKMQARYSMPANNLLLMFRRAD